MGCSYIITLVVFGCSEYGLQNVTSISFVYKFIVCLHFVLVETRPMNEIISTSITLNL